MTPYESRCKRRDTTAVGFTLIELVLVALIIGITATIAATRYAAVVTNQRVDAAARRIAADLTLARRNARLSSTSRTVTFDIATDTYAIAGIVHLDRSSQSYSVDLGDSPYEVIMLALDFGGNAIATFDGYGAPDSGGRIVVGAGLTGRLLTMDAGIGDVTIVPIALPLTEEMRGSFALTK